MNCLHIIGATGYIGRPLLAAAKQLSRTQGTSSHPNGELAYLNFESPDDFEYLSISEGDVIFVTAAISSPDICANEHARAWAINVDGTSAFIARALDRRARVVFFSSDAVYGENEAEFEEITTCNPAGEYGAMKHAVEQRFADSTEFKSVRLSYVFSASDKFTRYLTDCAKRGAAADIFHPFYRSIIHRDDVIAGALALSTSWESVPECVVNFGGPEVLSRVDFAQTMHNVCMPDLTYGITQPDAAFFNNRPRVIAMKSPVLPRIIGRPTHSLEEAARIEFFQSNTEGFDT